MPPVEPERAQQRNAAPSRLFRDDTRFALGRIAVFQYLAVAVFLFLIGGFWVLQIRDEKTNTELAERNRIKTVPLLAPRGKILDRDGRVIVDNHSAFALTLSRETLRPEHIAAIADGLQNIKAEEIRGLVARAESRRVAKYVPLVIKQDLTPAELSFVESHRDADTFPEMDLAPKQSRLYPQGGLAAHVIGYVGEVSEQELNTPEFAKYSQGEIIGKEGLERQYNDQLMGVNGQLREVVDSMGRERQKVEKIDFTPGSNLQLTLDLDLQTVGELAMEGRRGALVALDPRNGEVLAMVSRPAFDPNLFTRRISKSDWKELSDNPDNPLMNRAIQAQFAPGSTFKPIVTIAGLETGMLEPSTSVLCPGYATFYGHKFNCDEVHGTVDLHRAIVHSCDVFFFTVGNRMGIDRIAEYAELAGLGKKTGIDLPNEREGLVPSPHWKLRVQREKWYAGETISVAIGQGPLTVTPIQLASVLGGLVSGGVWYRPHLVKNAHIDPPRRADFHPENVATVVSGMCGVVNEGGTGAGAAIPGLEICGKTGTAQRISNELAKSNKALALAMRDNGWFVGFAPRENPEIVVVALWEGGGKGAFSAPIVRDVIKAYFDKKARLAKPGLPVLSLFTDPKR
ncbi:MAG TPA: penicillin-binding protein 2 [Bryobacteraceae bacterium]|jgi:penicillin-binding protein 2|nr:penicillin-binding protein 2 [Bryobacteraceae bacterium]